ncbi:TraB/GumN family protein [Parasphingorhabdus sp.]|jgi:uncharacterized protein YbaP (TraB family)|uniref:TraB/GumN family protein n=1 Tax=Parasphingorhabdus sp. TaxID=2709688 RepID=UPI0009EE1BDA
MIVMRCFAFLFAFMAACGLSACNNRPEQVDLNIANNGTPGLWKVSGTRPDQKGSAYMFGTIHILPKDVTWRTPKLESAISSSDRLIVEVVGLEDKQNAAKIFSKLAVSPDQPAIEQRVQPSFRGQLEEFIDKTNVSERNLNRLETWAAALHLASAQTSNMGLGSGIGVESELSDQFKALNKPIEALETIEKQLGYFDQLPEAQQRQMLVSVVSEADQAQQSFEQLFNAWILGDSAKLVELSEGGILADAKIREYILIARNIDWADQLALRLKQPGISFVAVGAAHLVGPDAVQKMLAKRGYKIEKIQ